MWLTLLAEIVGALLLIRVVWGAREGGRSRRRRGRERRKGSDADDEKEREEKEGGTTKRIR